MDKPFKLSISNALRILLLLFISFVAAVSSVNAQRNWSEYKQWCESQNGIAYPNPPRCVPRSAPSGGNSSSNSDAEAARKADEERRAREEAEASERDRAAEEKRKQDEINQKAFDAARDEAARTLKGSTGTTIRSNSSDNSGLRGSGSGDTGGTELRGSRDSTGLRTGKPLTEIRDFSGPHAAWKELFCAASILGPAISKLGIDGNGTNADYAAFKVLASEATNALNGEVKGVPCAKAPEPPTFSSKYSDPAKLAEAGIRLVDKAVDLATKLEKAREQKTAARAELNKPAPPVTPATPDESVMAQQRRIIAMREAEAKRIAQAQRDFNTGVSTENEAKAKLGKIADDVKKAAEHPEHFAVLMDEMDEDAPAPPESRPAKPKTPLRRHGKP